MSFEETSSNLSGPVIIITAPSGSGKTTLVKHLLVNLPQLEFSISATTRSKRAFEVDGKDYHFLTVEQFLQFKEKDLFVEWEEVYTNQFYGTLKSEVIKIWKKGKVVVFDVDVVGALALLEKFKNQSLSIFIKAPSLEILGERLKNRSTESPESLQKRLLKAENEITYANLFDCILVNDDLEKAQNQLMEIVNKFLTQLNIE